MPGQPAPGSNPILTIDCTALNVADLNNPPDFPSPLIHQQNQPFEVSTVFTIGGIWNNWFANTAAHQYTVRYFCESIGGGFEGLLAAVGPKSMNGLTTQGQAQTKAVVPAGLAAGTYKLSVVVSFAGAPPMTAFFEGPMIEIF